MDAVIEGNYTAVRDPCEEESAQIDAGATFEALYDRYSRLVYGLALRILADPSLAEDVTQTVFLKVWRARETFRYRNVTAWIARVARNQAVDMLRATHSRAESEFPAAMPTEDGLEDTALARIEASLVREAMLRLPDNQRELIELGFFGGVTHEELARRLDVPLGTVKTRIRSGLRKLRNLLETSVTA
jgi:RNA polymerase sigma-70 factor, ECF subfamily